ncbi:MAG: hypothetical protein E7379_00190 [Clostridiales bacterium]|nr:hypothetical protein [Clostridiales bacterium]
MKKIILVFTLIFSLSFFVGCQGEDYSIPTSSIMNRLVFSSTGEITQTISFNVDSDYIKSISKKGEDVVFVNNLVKQVDLLRQKFLLSFALVYLDNPIENLKIGQGVKLTLTSYKTEFDVVSFDMIFASNYSFQYYHNVLTNDDIQPSAPFLIKKHSSTSAFPFSVKNASGEIVAEDYKNIYLSASKGLSFKDKLEEEYSPSFVYNYCTFSNKIKSDADFVFSDSEGLYNHVWIKDDISLQNSTLTIYYYQINKGNWLMLALVCPCVCLGGYCLFKWIKNKN